MNKVLSNVPPEIPVGSTILYPTETVYGLGCRYDDDDALKAIYRLKGRDGKVPVALIASERSWVEEHFRASTHCLCFDGCSLAWATCDVAQADRP